MSGPPNPISGQPSRHAREGESVSSIGVVLVDDHPLVARAAEEVLASHGQRLVGVATDGRAGVELIARRRPAVAVVDLNLPGLSGLELIREVQQRRLGAAVVVLSATLNRRPLTEALEAGAAGLVSKESLLERLAEAIETAAAGGRYIDPRLRRVVAGAGRVADPLSPRERAVLGLLARGRTLQAAALELGISTETVRTHVQNARLKLGARSSTEAVAEALASGEIDLDPDVG